MDYIKHILLHKVSFDNQTVLFPCHLFYTPESDFYLLLNHLKGVILLVRKDLFSIDDDRYGIEEDSDFYIKLHQRGFIDKTVLYDSYPSCDNINPYFFLIDITNNCNLKCCYCFRNFSSQRNIHDNVLDVACDKIKEHCLNRGIRNITIQPWGGEPLLAFDKIERIYRNFSSSGVNACLTIETNGTLLTREIINRIKRMNIHIGISLDGCRTVHDIQRPYRNGDGSYDDIVKNISLCHELDCNSISIISVLTKFGLSYIDESIDTFVHKLKIPRFRFNLAHKSSFKDEDFSFPVADIEKFTTKLFENFIHYSEMGVMLEEGSILQRFWNILYKNDNNICFSRGCQGGYKMISVGMNGEIYPCELIDYPNECIGSIYEAISLNKMIERAREEKKFFGKRSVSICKKCPWLYFCRGGCTSNALYYTKQCDNIDIMGCTLNRSLYPMIIRRLLDDYKYKYRFLE